MGSVKSLQNVIQIIQRDASQNPVVTVSAMSGVTNQLLALVNTTIKKGKVNKKQILEIKNKHQEVIEALIQTETLRRKTVHYIEDELQKLKYFLEAIAITGELTTRSHDIIISLGEKFAAFMLTEMLQDRGIATEYVNLERLIQKKYEQADPYFFREAEKKLAAKLKPLMHDKIIPICTGFFGKIPGGILEGVGRGYSDFTCALIGAGLKVKEIQIWTDVDGMLSADPRVVKEAHVLEQISFKEASELAHFGAKILHPQTIHPAITANIPVRLLNTFNLQNNGTLILPHETHSDHQFKSIAVKKNNTIIRICSSRMLMAYGFLAKVFDIFGKYQISVDLVATSEVNISLSVDNHPDQLNRVVKELKTLGKVYLYPEHSIISIVGQEVTQNTTLAGRVFSAIESADIDIRLISQGASQINLSFMVEDKDADRVLKIAHETICGKGGK